MKKQKDRKQVSFENLIQYKALDKVKFNLIAGAIFSFSYRLLDGNR